MLKFQILMNAMQIRRLYYDSFKELLFGQSALEGTIKWYYKNVHRLRINFKMQ